MPQESPNNLSQGEATLLTLLRNSVKRLALQESAGAESPESDIKVDDEIKTLERDGLREKYARIKNLHQIRKVYLGLLFILTMIWLVTVVVFVSFAGFGYRGFKLADSVIIAFITSTTVSVIGLFHFAAKWLFPARRRK